MHEATALLLAGFSTRIREGTAVTALMLLLHFLLMFCSTVTILVVARAARLLFHNTRVSGCPQPIARKAKCTLSHLSTSQTWFLPSRHIQAKIRTQPFWMSSPQVILVSHAHVRATAHKPCSRLS